MAKERGLVVRARAPLRLGLAGGGTDVAPYCDEHVGYVLNATIDRYAYAVIRVSNNNTLRFEATDLGVQEQVYLNATEASEDTTDTTSITNLFLHFAVYKTIMNQFNSGRFLSLSVSTYCDAPAGSGLGSSSTLVVAMVRAYVELLNLPLDDYSIANLAYKIERLDCGLQGGRQDQFSATFGGVNFIEFHRHPRTTVNPLRVKNWILCELEASLVLYFTGVSRESARIIAEQSGNVHENKNDALNAMHSVKREALIMKECLLKGDFDGFVMAMRRGWAAKKQSASTVSNSNIDAVYEAAMEAGALAGKVSGAGGGGFMWFFVPNEKRMNVCRTLESFGGQAGNCHFTKSGCQAWRP